MNFSQYAGVAIVPTLSRLVLAATFLFTGYGKLFTSADFDAKQAEQLKTLGVNPTPKVEKAAATAMTLQSRIVAASYRQDAATTQPGAAQPSESAPPPVATPPATETPAKPAESVSPAGADSTIKATTYTARSMHQITLMLNGMGWPAPVWQAWAVSLTEFLGGGFLLIGLFSRLWGLGLATVMGFAFYLTSIPTLQTTHVLELNPQQFSTAVLQLSLFVLAFGVMLTGAGPLSLDRFLFSRSEAPMIDEKKRER